MVNNNNANPPPYNPSVIFNDLVYGEYYRTVPTTLNKDDGSTVESYTFEPNKCGKQSKESVLDRANKIAAVFPNNIDNQFPSYEHDYVYKLEKQINDEYYDGDPFSPRSFSDLMGPVYTYKCKFKDNSWTIIKKPLILTSFFSYLEGIPVLGTPIALILAVGRLITSELKFRSLEKAVREYKDLSNDPDAKEDQKLYKASKVFNKAIKYTNESNLTWASVSAIWPFVKPGFGLIRGTLSSMDDTEEK